MRSKKYIPAVVFFSASLVLQNFALTAAASEDRLSMQTILRYLSAGERNTDWQRRQDLERLLNDHKSEATTLLTNALDSSDADVQRNASEILSRITSNWEFVVSDHSLATILGIMKSSRSSVVKCNLVRTIGHIGPRNDKLQPLLLDILKSDPDASVRTACADAIAGFMREEKPAAASEAVKTMCFCLKSDISPHVRRGIAQAMGNLPSPPDEVINALAAAMDDNYKQVRTAACSALSRFGARSKMVMPLLSKMFEEEKDWPSRQQTLSAMVQIDKKNPKVFSAIILAMDETHLASTAMCYLQQLGADASPAVPRLIKVLESNSDIHLRAQAANTLGAIGPAAQKALPALNKCAATEDANLKNSIDNAIRRIGVTRQLDIDNNVGGSVL